MERTRIALLALLLVCHGVWGVKIDAFFLRTSDTGFV
jgi:hypothetical protein